MERHVNSVRDFMSLVKSIQALIAPAAMPRPSVGEPTAHRLVNSIVLEEESDRNRPARDAFHNCFGVGVDHAFRLHFYLERHIERDEDFHPPMSLQVFDHLCGADESMRTEASLAAITAQTVRHHLGDALAGEIAVARGAALRPMAQPLLEVQS